MVRPLVLKTRIGYIRRNNRIWTNIIRKSATFKKTCKKKKAQKKKKRETLTIENIIVDYKIPIIYSVTVKWTVTENHRKDTRTIMFSRKVL